MVVAEKVPQLLVVSLADIYSKSGQNGTWGQNGTPGVLEKHARHAFIFKSTWFLSSASPASCVEIKLAIDHAFSISQKRNFTILINQFSRVSTSSALTNLVVEPLHVVKYNYVPVVRIFTWWPFSKLKTRGQNGTWYVGAKLHCGAKQNGQNGTMSFTHKGVSFCPNALVHFTPRPFHPRKFQWRSG